MLFYYFWATFPLFNMVLFINVFLEIQACTNPSPCLNRGTLFPKYCFNIKYITIGNNSSCFGNMKIIFVNYKILKFKKKGEVLNFLTAESFTFKF
jgi:hypothetical protein